MLRVVGAILVAIVVVSGIWSFWPEREETVAPATETTSTAEAPADSAPAPSTDNVPAPAAEPGDAAAPASAAKPAEMQTAQAGGDTPASPPAGNAPAPAGDAAKPAEDGAKPAANESGGNAAPAAGAAKPAGDQAAAPAGGGAAADEGGNPKETAEKAEKGSLKNPNGDPAAVADAGQKVYMSAGCNGCHGGTGGGGMGPPLTNEIWVYGTDDDTLFRLIALGSDGLKAQGYSRKGSEAVVGPMPPHGGIVKSNGDMWKIISWIRKINPSSGG